MRKIPPVGGSSTDQFVDGNAQTGTKGSILPAEFPNAVIAELVHLIEHAALTPNANDNQQVRKAVEALIAAAGGGGGGTIDTSAFVQMAATRLLMPMHAEVVSADGKMTFTTPVAGTVRVAAGQKLVHRGVFEVTSDQTDFAVTANKTYHVRWTKADGFVIRDVANSGYNPGGLPEQNSAFDSTFDDVLLARVVTDASNVATVTALENRARLFVHATQKATLLNPASPVIDFTHSVSIPVNWGRRPQNLSVVPVKHVNFNGTGQASGDYVLMSGSETVIGSGASQSKTPSVTFDRYAFTGRLSYENAQEVWLNMNGAA